MLSLSCCCCCCGAVSAAAAAAVAAVAAQARYLVLPKPGKTRPYRIGMRLGPNFFRKTTLEIHSDHSVCVCVCVCVSASCRWRRFSFVFLEFASETWRSSESERRARLFLCVSCLVCHSSPKSFRSSRLSFVSFPVARRRVLSAGRVAPAGRSRPCDVIGLVAHWSSLTSLAPSLIGPR